MGSSLCFSPHTSKEGAEENIWEPKEIVPETLGICPAEGDTVESAREKNGSASMIDGGDGEG